jgi:6-phosphogluconolactonase
MFRRVLTANDPEQLAKHASQWLIEQIVQAHHKKGVCRIALAGGSTPKRLYQLLAEQPLDGIPWHAVQFYLGDERNVPLDDANSNYRMAKESLGAVLGPTRAHLFPVNIQLLTPEQSALEYETTLRESFGPCDTFPELDVVLLGLGDDAHTASLFPHTTALEERTRWVVSNWVEKLGTYRITMTAPLISAASQVAFLVSGSGKTQALSQIWHASHQPALYPAQLIGARDTLNWMIDSVALGSLAIPDGWQHVRLQA